MASCLFCGALHVNRAALWGTALFCSDAPETASHGPELLELLKRCSVTSAKTSVTGGGVAVGLLDNQMMLACVQLG